MMERDMEAMTLNRELEIVKLDKFYFDTPKGKVTLSGWGFRIPGKGFLRFRTDDAGIPYCPAGGKKALKEILEAGGFLSYRDIEFVNPVAA